MSRHYLLNRSKNFDEPWRRHCKRKGFTKGQQDAVFTRQGGRCEGKQSGCLKELRPHLYEFDHIDGDRTNASLSNAQALCVVCHCLKTAQQRKR